MHRRIRIDALLLLLACAPAGLGCTTYRDELARGERAFELNEHDRTLAILRDLEIDVQRLSPQEQAQYAYLRGMTDYRVGYRSDARHWLAVAKAWEDHAPGMLPAEWKTRTNEALVELNGVVYEQGTAALTTARLAEDATPQGAAPAKDEKKKAAPKAHPKDEPAER